MNQYRECSVLRSRIFIQEVYRREQYAEKSEDESGKKT